VAPLPTELGRMNKISIRFLPPAVSVTGKFQYFDTIGWVKRMASDLKTYHNYPQGLSFGGNSKKAGQLNKKNRLHV